MINTASFGVAFAEGEVDGAAHFLVKEDVFDAAIDAGVVAEGELTEIASTVVNVEHMQKVVLTMAGTGFDDFAFAEDEPHAFDSASIIGGGYVELNNAIGTVFEGACEEFATGEVTLAIA